jgi:hypothetical protein
VLREFRKGPHHYSSVRRLLQAPRVYIETCSELPLLAATDPSLEDESCVL